MEDHIIVREKIVAFFGLYCLTMRTYRTIMSGVFDIIQCKTSVAFANKDSSVTYLDNPPMLCY